MARAQDTTFMIGLRTVKDRPEERRLFLSSPLAYVSFPLGSIFHGVANWQRFGIVWKNVSVGGA